jgi:hypothetical protein
MRFSGNWTGAAALNRPGLLALLQTKIEQLDVKQAQAEVAPYVREKSALELWSKTFFQEIINRIETL